MLNTTRRPARHRPARQRPSASPSPHATATPATPGHALPLWQLLNHCAEAVAAVRAGQSLTEALAATPAPARPGAQALAFLVMRQLGTADHLCRQLLKRPGAPWVHALVLSALALAVSGDYPAHTLVDQAVNAAKRRAHSASGMVNAVLRRFERERDALLAQVQYDRSARLNHPEWWIAQVQADWPDHWEALLAADQQVPPMMLRVNLRHGSVANYLGRLQEAGLNAQPFGEAGLLLLDAVPVNRLPGFAAGDVSVQDASAQQAATLLRQAGLRPGARVLDACSAPGGKSAHILEGSDVHLLALDVDAQRLTRVDETLQRLGLSAGLGADFSANTQHADAAEPATWWNQEPFDAIVLDAPCSASGIVRRHPDVRWLRRPTDLPQLASIQDRLLDAMWPLLAPGGVLLYCTCSVFKIEGQQRVDAFLQRQPEAVSLPAPGHLLPVVEYQQTPPITPVVGDGFFYALLRKPGPC